MHGLCYFDTISNLGYSIKLVLVNDANQLVLVMHEMTLTVSCNKNMVMDGLDFAKISAKRHMNRIALNN